MFRHLLEPAIAPRDHDETVLMPGACSLVPHMVTIMSQENLSKLIEE